MIEYSQKLNGGKYMEVVFEAIKFVIGMILACGIVTSPFTVCFLAEYLANKYSATHIDRT